MPHPQHFSLTRIDGAAADAILRRGVGCTDRRLPKRLPGIERSQYTRGRSIATRNGQLQVEPSGTIIHVPLNESPELPKRSAGGLGQPWRRPHGSQPFMIDGNPLTPRQVPTVDPPKEWMGNRANHPHDEDMWIDSTEKP